MTLSRRARLLCASLSASELSLQVAFEFHQVVGERHTVGSQFAELHPYLLVDLAPVLRTCLYSRQQQGQFSSLSYNDMRLSFHVFLADICQNG